MTVRFQRLIIILLSLIFTAGAVILIMINSKENLVFFFTPTELINSHHEINSQVRIGGFVKNNSLKINTKNKICWYQIYIEQKCLFWLILGPPLKKMITYIPGFPSQPHSGNHVVAGDRVPAHFWSEKWKLGEILLRFTKINW